MSISGAWIAVDIGATLVPGVQAWTATGSARELSGTTAADDGYERPKPGLKSVRVTMQLVIDITTGTFSGLAEGAELTDVKLFANITAAEPIFTFPEFLVLSAAPGGEVEGRFMFNVEGKSQGPYTHRDPN